MRAIKYIRWSSDKQSKGSSLARQTKLIESFCDDMGWNEGSELLRDEGTSAWSGANIREGKLGEFTDRVVREGGRGLVLVVEQQDRISRRDTLEVIDWFSKVARAGLTIAFADSRTIVDEELLRKHPQLLRTILDSGSRANAESEYKSGRIREAWQIMREEGRPVHASSTCPAWLELSKDRLTFSRRPDRVALINRIFDLYIAGMGKRTIATLLNSEKVPPFRKGNGWHGSAVVHLLKNRAVLGEYQHHVRRVPTGEIVGDYFPQVVSNEKFQAANEPRHSRMMANRSRTSKVRNLLSDLAICHECGGKYIMITKRIDEQNRHDGYLLCDGAYRKLGCSSSKSFRYLKLETAILDTLLTMAMDDVHFAKSDDVTQINQELADQRRLIEDLGRRIEATSARLDMLAQAGMENDERETARYIALSRDEREAKATESEMMKRLTLAMGAVAPDEHVRRVQAVRADIAHEDEAIGYEARRLIKMALNDLIENVHMASAHGRAIVVLKGGVRTIVITRDGKVLDDISTWQKEASPDDPVILKDYFRRKAAAA